MTKQFTYNDLSDICNHGCSIGFNGLGTFEETTALYDQYREDIWQMINADHKKNGREFKNVLIWWAAEKIAYDLTQGEYLSRFVDFRTSMVSH